MGNPHDLRNTVPIAGMMKPTKRKRHTSRYSLDMFDEVVFATIADEDLSIPEELVSTTNISATQAWLNQYVNRTNRSGGDSD